MKMSLSCPYCGYETPIIEICDEFPTEKAVMDELEFWLYENHGGSCPYPLVDEEESTLLSMTLARHEE
tara:strand:+ start:473 stop:676 length:204 start_codon:yes stop_codon:yes gene_type:complete